MNTSTNLSCYDFSRKEYDAAFYTKLSVASMGVLTSILVVLLILVSKSYKHFVFRLVIYFMVANILQAISHILELIPVTHTHGEVAVRDGWSAVCSAFGFFDQVTVWMGNMGIYSMDNVLLAVAHSPIE